MSSFIRHNSTHSKPRARGTRAWINSLSLASIGHATVDELLGGGVAVGGLVVLVEDTNTQYYRMMERYFLAEGVAHGHEVLVVSCDGSSEEEEEGVRGLLPLDVTAVKAAEEVADTLQELDSLREEQQQHDLQIAWRYQQYLGAGPAGGVLPGPPGSPPLGPTGPPSPTAGASPFGPPRVPQAAGTLHTMGQRGRSKKSASLCHKYDLSKPAAQEQLDAARIELADVLPAGDEDPFASALTSVQAFLDEAKGDGSTGCAPRVLVRSLGSPLWGDCSTASATAAIIRLLTRVRVALRDSDGVALVTVPASCLPASTVTQLKHLSDACFGIASFIGTPHLQGVAPQFPEHDGIVTVERVKWSNCQSAVRLPHREWLFRAKRRGLSLEPLSLQPETTRDTEKPHPKPSSAGCGSTDGPLSSPFDF